MPKNLEFVLSAYGISVTLIIVYSGWVLLKIQKFKKEKKQLDEN